MLFDNHKKKNTYLERIDHTIRKIKYNVDNTELIESTLIEIYEIVKEASLELYINGNIHKVYDNIWPRILDVEKLLENKYIIDTYVDTDFNNLSIKNPKKYEEPEIILDWLVAWSRKNLCTDFYGKKDINSTNLVNMCPHSQDEVTFLANILEIKNYPLTIYAAYTDDIRVFNGSGFHKINIIELYGKYYLVDCTYKQFFTKGKNLLDRNGIAHFSGCNVGKFMTMTKERLNVANTLLKKGWIELNEQVLKNYLDGFTIRTRNGLYYEKNNDFSYTTKYTVDDYIKFLLKEDNQVNHEGEYVLGIQLKPLTKKIKF